MVHSVRGNTNLFVFCALHGGSRRRVVCPDLGFRVVRFRFDGLWCAA